MTLEEAIRHCEEEAEEQQKIGERNEDTDCLECASEHRQLAEWMRELKARRQVMVNVKEQIKAWKQNDFQNHDYATGFISALSNIEGLIAYSQEQLGVVVCEFEGGES